MGDYIPILYTNLYYSYIIFLYYYIPILYNSYIKGDTILYTIPIQSLYTNLQSLYYSYIMGDYHVSKGGWA